MAAAFSSRRRSDADRDPVANLLVDLVLARQRDRELDRRSTRVSTTLRPSSWSASRPTPGRRGRRASAPAPSRGTCTPGRRDTAAGTTSTRRAATSCRRAGGSGNRPRSRSAASRADRAARPRRAGRRSRPGGGRTRARGPSRPGRSARAPTASRGSSPTPRTRARGSRRRAFSGAPTGTKVSAAVSTASLPADAVDLDVHAVSRKRGGAGSRASRSIGWCESVTGQRNLLQLGVVRLARDAGSAAPLTGGRRRRASRRRSSLPPSISAQTSGAEGALRRWRAKTWERRRARASCRTSRDAFRNGVRERGRRRARQRRHRCPPGPARGVAGRRRAGRRRARISRRRGPRPLRVSKRTTGASTGSVETVLHRALALEEEADDLVAGAHGGRAARAQRAT